MSLNENENAELDFSSAVLLKPFSDTAYYCRGYVRGLLHKHQEALSDYDKAILINPEYQTAYVNRGNIKSDIEDYEGALMDYSMSLGSESRGYQRLFQ